MRSVSTTVGFTSSARRPRTSAACMAMEALVPPMSGLPSTKFTLPSAVTLMAQLEGMPMLNQKPTEAPRPLFGPPRGAFQ